MLNKSFDPNALEPVIFKRWQGAGIPAAGRKTQSGTGAPFSISMPPPNVTGRLHIGHALTYTIQDILTRYQRMRGRDVLWQPGMDHAGIATQMLFERHLAGQGKTRHDLGRDRFIQQLDQWKSASQESILQQMHRLGDTADWSRERFTLDAGLSAAVRKVFVHLYQEGLIYKDTRLVNWDPKLQTAISDLEVLSKETNGNLWHFRYPIEGEDGQFITIATTRPETMLGDTAVAVHPEDERYKELIGKKVRLPIVGRLIPIVADDYADPEQGSGAVKITPAHDFNDFEVGRRHGLEQISILDREAKICAPAPDTYCGMDRFAARKKIVADLEALGLLAEIENHTHAVPYGDRSGDVIEPLLTEQWYVDAETLAKPAIAAVETGKTEFVPKNWEKTYFDWMRNIQPWCISRQLWWGHRIPAWYGPDDKVFVAETEDEARAAARAHYGEAVTLRQDEDVLDTWFSSGLWPFSTLGWPDETPELEKYYPTSVLVTGFDIIFFWVARMMMMGLHFTKDVPFKTVYVHALVRDEKGQKMSKSKGNVIDPLELCDTYGADSVRFTLAAMAAQGRDIKLSTQRVEGYRNFGTKLWNAARFCQMNECVPRPGYDPSTAKETVNRWILGEAQRAQAAATEAMDAYKFNEAAAALYGFIWHVFCDWYVEFIKPLLLDGEEAVRDETRHVAAFVLDHILRILHPIMPFITEELWHSLAEHGPERASMLAVQPWPALPGSVQDADADAEMGWVIRVVSDIRSVRAEMGVPPGAKITALVTNADNQTRERAKRHEDVIKRLARLEWITLTDSLPPGSVQVVLDEAIIGLPLADVIDLGKEGERLSREIAKAQGEIAKIDKKLGNESFIAKAPEAVVEEQRERRADYAETARRLGEALERLRSALG